MKDALARYAEFFGLFGDFRGYVEHLLLQDLVSDDCFAVRPFMPFEDFEASPLPTNIDVNLSYRQLGINFIEARNRRMLQSC